MIAWLLLPGFLASPAVCALHGEAGVKDRVTRYGTLSVLTSQHTVWTRGEALADHTLATACIKGQDVTETRLTCTAKGQTLSGCQDRLALGTHRVSLDIRSEQKAKSVQTSVQVDVRPLGGARVRVNASCGVYEDAETCQPDLQVTDSQGQPLKNVRWAVDLEEANRGLWSETMPHLVAGRYQLIAQGLNGQNQWVAGESPAFYVSGHLLSVGPVTGGANLPLVQVRKRLLSQLEAQSYLRQSDADADARWVRSPSSRGPCVDHVRGVPPRGRLCVELSSRGRKRFAARVRILRPDGHLELLPPVSARGVEGIAQALSAQVIPYLHIRHRQSLKEGHGDFVGGVNAVARLKLETDADGATVSINGEKAKAIPRKNGAFSSLPVKPWHLVVKAPGEAADQINLFPVSGDSLHLKVRFKPRLRSTVLVDCQVEDPKLGVTALVDGHSEMTILQGTGGASNRLTTSPIPTSSGHKTIRLYRSDGASQLVEVELPYGQAGQVSCDPKKWVSGVVYLRTDAPIDLGFCIDTTVCAPVGTTVDANQTGAVRILYGGSRARLQRVDGLAPGPHFIYVQREFPHQVAVFPFTVPAEEIIEIPWSRVHTAQSLEHTTPMATLPPPVEFDWVLWSSVALATAGASTFGFGYYQQHVADDAEAERFRFIHERGRDDVDAADRREAALRSRNMLYIASGTLLTGALTLAIHAMTDEE